MKLVQENSSQYKYEKTRKKTPVEAFKACPHCGNLDLLPVQEEVICFSCDWNSVAINVATDPELLFSKRHSQLG